MVMVSLARWLDADVCMHALVCQFFSTPKTIGPTFAAAPKLDDAMAYVQKLAARSVAHQLSTAGGAMLAGMDAATARALAAQARGLYRGGWTCAVSVWVGVCQGLEGENVSLSVLPSIAPTRAVGYI